MTTREDGLRPRNALLASIGGVPGQSVATEAVSWLTIHHKSKCLAHLPCDYTLALPSLNWQNKLACANERLNFSVVSVVRRSAP